MSEEKKKSGFSTSVAPVGVLMNPLPLDQASKHARKVYIGNLPPSVTQEIIIAQFFNHTLSALLPNKPLGDSIIGTYINTTKRFAFIENRSIEETTFTLTLDGIMMEGYALKLRRPQDYNAALARQQLAVEMELKGGISALRGAACLSSNQARTSIVSTSVDDGPNKVFIGGLPHHMMEFEVKELLSTFGALKAFHLVKDREADRSKGYAFCEWRDPSVTDAACEQLNGTKVGDRYLNVRRAVGHSGRPPIDTTTGLPMLGPGDRPEAIADDPSGAAAAGGAAPGDAVTVAVPWSQLSLPRVALWLNGQTPAASRCLAVARANDKEHLSADQWARLVVHVKKTGNQVGFVRSCRFHAGEGGRVLAEFSTAVEAHAACDLLHQQAIEGTTLTAHPVPLPPDTQEASFARLKSDIDRSAAMTPDARLVYYQHEQKLRLQKLPQA
ncbi:RNA recognition motif protein [Gregarina niphandrodes]|uniref:RNA recognition motif protein n=1 Tax=Gregarina niphandrodes TaxID=110365 RepID=A0A023AY70_GRENI|nr:RNA recognition motif protein [Gregarina niphandrodes]EZG43607.1 RNA recognition motif protein [Gregarina niphandrodes]|eukprot:XP_011133161.1 RNA recognition motif protein [Gregarina niphandrodes]